MSTLTVFLLARIAEDEALAAATSRPHWHAGVSRIETDFPVEVRATGLHYGDARHIARHDPARVLAECEARRRIVDNATNMHTSGPDWDEACRILALPYADHPDYREEWRP